MSIEASQPTSQPIKLTAKQHMADTACKKCGTFVRNFISRACIECDRIRALKAYRAKHPKSEQKPKPLPVVEPKPTPKKTKVPPKPSAEAHAINSAIFAKPEPLQKGGVLTQPTSDADRYSVSERLAADIEAFLAKGGKVNQGAA